MEPNLQDLSINDCVKISGRSVSTVRRKRDKIIELGATCADSGWHVTIEQLAAVGIAGKVSPIPPTHPHVELIESLKKQIQLIENTLELERARNQKLEERLDRLIPPANTTSPTQPQPQPQPETETEAGPEPEPVRESVVEVKPQPKQSFWGRLFSR